MRPHPTFVCLAALFLCGARALSAPQSAQATRPTPAVAEPQLARIALASSYDAQLASVEAEWATFRKLLDTRRRQGRLTDPDYKSMVGRYDRAAQFRAAAATSGRGNASGAGRARAEASPQVAGAASASPQRQAAMQVIASRVTLADAKVKLAEAEARQHRDTSALAEQSKRAMIESLSGKDLDALRAHVEDHFPVAQANMSYEAYAAEVEAFSSGLQTMSADGSKVAPPLTITSEPSGATFRIMPKYSPENVNQTSTAATFEFLFLGTYKYTISAPNYQTYEGILDWVNNLQPKLVCTLAPANAVAASASACQQVR